MGFFNFFKRKSNNYIGADTQAKTDLPENKNGQLNEIPHTDNSIELLFHFLDRNHEIKGYDDALINADTNHMEQNIQALKNELERTVFRVKSFYEDFIKEVDFHIASRSRSGMIDTVEELRMKKEIAEGHIKKVLQIEEDAKNNRGDSQGIVMSYTRGFRNGLAAISHHAILKRKL